MTEESKIYVLYLILDTSCALVQWRHCIIIHEHQTGNVAIVVMIRARDS